MQVKGELRLLQVLSYAEEGNPLSMASMSRQSIDTNDSERVEFSVLTNLGV